MRHFKYLFRQRAFAKAAVRILVEDAFVVGFTEVRRSNIAVHAGSRVVACMVLLMPSWTIYN